MLIVDQEADYLNSASYIESKSFSYGTGRVESMTIPRKGFVSTGGVSLSVVTGFPVDTTSTASVLKFSHEYAELSGYIEWLADFYHDGHSLTEMESMLPYFQHINAMLVEHCFERCDDFLRLLNANCLSDEMLIGVLRLTYSAKNQLPSWTAACEKVSMELQIRGEDHSSLLQGLL